MTTKWTEVQIMAARAIAAIERNDPLCPGCSAGVFRAKCFHEDEDCPRHEIATSIRIALHQIEKLGGLPPTWRYEMSLFERIGPVSGQLLDKLKWMEARKDYKFKSPGMVESLAGLVGRGIVNLSTGGAEGRGFNYSLDQFGLQYIEAMKAAGLWGEGLAEPDYLVAYVKCGRKAGGHLGPMFFDWEEFSCDRGEYVEHYIFRKPVEQASVDDRQLARDYSEPFTGPAE